MAPGVESWLTQTVVEAGDHATWEFTVEKAGAYRVEVLAYDRSSGWLSFQGALGLDVEPAAETWAEVLLSRP